MSIAAIHDVAAPAKLNLFLHIIGRRADGYHLLQSVFVLVDWCDTLHLERRSDGRLLRHDLTEPLPANDLCLRAARALQQASGTRWGADISIDKCIPSGAGMGGGSSDAASTLLALNRLWALGWPVEKLMPIGLTLGADVPFFLGGDNAWVEGIGERLTPVDVQPQWFAVLKPSASVATKELFGHPKVVRDSDTVILEGFRAADGSCSLNSALTGGYGRNDLQTAAESLCSDVARAGQKLETAFGNSRMTGSGSAVFARWSDTNPPEDDSLARKVGELPAGWVGRLCRSLSRHPLAGW